MAAAAEQRAADVGAGGTNSGIDHASGRSRSSLNHHIVRIPDITMGKHVLIIGGGIAGLAAGCYARMNGFKATVVEQHFLPGGLCTSWEREGFVFDGCLSYLCGAAFGWEALQPPGARSAT